MFYPSHTWTHSSGNLFLSILDTLVILLLSDPVEISAFTFSAVLESEFESCRSLGFPRFCLLEWVRKMKRCFILFIHWPTILEISSFLYYRAWNSLRKQFSRKWTSKIAEKYIFLGKNRQAYFFRMKIKMMDLWMQIEGTKLIFVMNFSVLDLPPEYLKWHIF